MTRIAKSGLVVLVACAFAACASGRKLIGTQTVVERMPSSRPAWVDQTGFEKNGTLYYKGAVMSRADMALGLREARGEAEKAIVEQIKQRIRTEFGSAIEGQNVDDDLGSHVRDLIAEVSENVEVSGIQQAEQYVEKVEVQMPAGVRYVWNCNMLLALAKSDYLEARRLALDGAVAKARQEQNAKAEETLKAAFQKLEGDNPSGQAKL